MTLDTRLMQVKPIETRCACAYRTGRLTLDESCGEIVYSYRLGNEHNTWLWCDTCYLGECQWCKRREGDGHG